MADLSDLEKRIGKIEARNSEKEADKAWETSLARRSLVALLTYLIIGLFMQSNGITKPWLSAIIPTTGFLLSTLGLSLFKSWWLKSVYRTK